MKIPAATSRGDTLAALLGSLVLAGCALGPAASPAPSPPPTATPSPAATDAPTATTTPTLTTAPTSPPAATATAAEPTDYGQPPPPLGQLGATDELPVAGRLVSWCYYAGCLDGRPPPKAQLPLVELSAADKQLVFAMPQWAPFVTWSASYARRSVTQDEKPLGRGGPDDPSEPPPGTPTLTEVTFAAPSVGDWVVNVSVWFGGEVGDAHYYWHVVVP